MPIDTKKIILQLIRPELCKETLEKLSGYAHLGTIPGTIVLDVTADDTRRIHEYLMTQPLPPVFADDFGKYPIGQPMTPTDTFGNEISTEPISDVDTDESSILDIIINLISDGIVVIFGI